MIDIDALRERCAHGAIKWTAHVMARLQERGIDPSDVKNCIITGTIIEQYPDDYPYPSCLVLGDSKSGDALHVVVGSGEGYLWLVTAYYPDPKKWNDDFSSRKER
jgi:hypothetical protein